MLALLYWTTKLSSIESSYSLKFELLYLSHPETSGLLLSLKVMVFCENVFWPNLPTSWFRWKTSAFAGTGVAPRTSSDIHNRIERLLFQPWIAGGNWRVLWKIFWPQPWSLEPRPCAPKSSFWLSWWFDLSDWPLEPFQYGGLPMIPVAVFKLEMKKFCRFIYPSDILVIYHKGILTWIFG